MSVHHRHNAIKTIVLVFIFTSLICLRVPAASSAVVQNKVVKYVQSSIANATAPYRPVKPETASITLEADTAKSLIYEPKPRRDWSTLPGETPARMEQFRIDGYVFATMFCSRDYHEQDPYLAATQQVIWRLLWSRWYSSHPIVVFVCPFVEKSVRKMFRAQGAWVEELALVDIPHGKLSFARWRDQFAKLNLWSYTKFKRIVYLDSDAFPIANIDDIFEIVKPQQCNTTMLEEVDRRAFSQDCEYVFGGAAERDPWLEHGQAAGTNGGFLVLKPDKRMHQRLLRNARRTSEYDQGYMEQSLLSSFLGFGVKSAFPAQAVSPIYNFGGRHLPRLGPPENSTLIDLTWNATKAIAGIDGAFVEKTLIPANTIKIIHDKLWSPYSFVNYAAFVPYWQDMWSKDWMTMSRLYDNPVFDLWRRLGRLPTFHETNRWIEEMQEAARKLAKAES